MKGRICLCPASIAWIRKHLMKSARRAFNNLLIDGVSLPRSIKKRRMKLRSLHRKKSRKRPTAKQLRARRLFVKRVKRGDFR